MSDERRDEERSHTIRNVELVTVDRNGVETAFPLILRDSGGAGFGGVYVGQSEFAPEGEAMLRDEETGSRRVQIVWTTKVADYVHMVGLESCDE